jgi:hypothetical protein
MATWNTARCALRNAAVAQKNAEAWLRNMSSSNLKDGITLSKRRPSELQPRQRLSEGLCFWGKFGGNHLKEIVKYIYADGNEYLIPDQDESR